MDYINYIKQSPMMGQIGLGGGATSLGRYASGTGSGPRGIWGGGQPITSVIDFVTINTTANATSFGSLISAKRWITGCSNGTRGLFCGGSHPSTDQIQYITCATTGDAQDFGDLTTVRYKAGGLGNATRGLIAGDDGPLADRSSIDYVAIATLGNASDFGELTVGRQDLEGCASQTRGLFCGGYMTSSGPAGTWSTNVIDYVTIASAGNATDYGDLEQEKNDVGCVDNDTRACIGGGGWQSNNKTNAIGYVTIANTGNTTDFGDLTAARKVCAGTDDKTAGVDRGCFGGGFDDTTWFTTIDYITISNTGNASDFGDLTVGRSNGAGVSGGDAA